MNGVELTKEVKHRYPEVMVAALSAYDDFSFVKESMRLGAEDYILKQAFDGEKVIEILQQIRIKKLQASIERLDEDKYQKELAEYLQHNIPLNEESKMHFCKLFKASHLAVFLLMAGDIPAIDTIVLNEPSFVYVTKQKNNLWLLIYRVPKSNSTEKTRRFLFDLSGRLKHYTNKEGHLAYCDSSAVLTELPELYQRAKITSDYFVFWPERDRIVYSDIRRAESIRKRDYIYELPEIIPATTPENIELILNDLMKRLMDYMPDKNHIDQSFLNVYRGFAQNKTTPADDMEMIGFYERLQLCPSLKDKQEYTINRVRLEWREEVIQYQGKSGEIMHALEYIHKHYTADLSLSRIAEHVRLSESYFSNLFKQETGENLTFYINRLRIGYAKELLRSQNMKVYEVAEHVGYQNAAYLSTMFRKITGQSVSEYKAELTRRGSLLYDVLSGAGTLS